MPVFLSVFLGAPHGVTYGQLSNFRLKSSTML